MVRALRQARPRRRASDRRARPRRHRRRRPHGPRAGGGHRALERAGGPPGRARARRRVRHEPRGAALVRPHRVGHPQDDRPPPPARGRHDRRPLPRGPPPPPRGALPRRDRRRQGLPGREAVRHRSRRGRADRRRRSRTPASSCAARARCPSSPARSSPTRRSRRARWARSSRSSTTSCTPATSIAPSRSTGSARRATAERSASWATSGCTSPTCRCGSGWRPATVFAQLSDLVTERPDPQTGEPVPCDTIDNATLQCDAGFPLTLRTHRIAPGHMNTWRILGDRHGRRRELLDRPAEDRAPLRAARRAPGVGALRGRQPVGLRHRHRSRSSSSASPTRSCRCGPPTWPSAPGALGARFGCATPREALDAHRLFDAALRSGADPPRRARLVSRRGHCSRRASDCWGRCRSSRRWHRTTCSAWSRWRCRARSPAIT